MKSTASILLSFLLLPIVDAHAQKIYLCKDAAGRTLTSDRAIPECADRAVRMLDSNGMMRREIPAPLTAEQKRQQLAEEERQKAEEAAALEQKHTDRALMARYRTESDITAARKRTLELVQEQVNREANLLAMTEKNRKETQAEIARQKNKQNVISALQHQLEESEQALKDGKKKIQEYDKELANIAAKYDAALKRYRELNGVTAAR